jgi:hypothetical protein
VRTRKREEETRAAVVRTKDVYLGPSTDERIETNRKGGRTRRLTILKPISKLEAHPMIQSYRTQCQRAARAGSRGSKQAEQIVVGFVGFRLAY